MRSSVAELNMYPINVCMYLELLNMAHVHAVTVQIDKSYVRILWHLKTSEVTQQQQFLRHPNEQRTSEKPLQL